MTGRLPPNQGLIKTASVWPVVGEAAPRAGTEPCTPEAWTVTVSGLVKRPLTVSLAALMARPQAERVVDFHCVTRWSKFDMRFSGVALSDLLAEAGVDAAARFVRFVARSDRAHDTSLSLADTGRCDPLVAFAIDGAPLPEEHGGPVRIVTPGKYGYKSLKWLERIELLAENKLGYWESGPGYHDNADPWAEERYVTGNIPPDLRGRMIATRRLGGRNLLSVDFAGEDLAALDAAGATLRNCRFDEAELTDADFSGANLSNASLRGAKLAGARFVGADVEGADFTGADLTGADFTEASLFGASFGGADGEVGARLDGARITREQALRLVDAEQIFVVRALDL